MSTSTSTICPAPFEPLNCTLITRGAEAILYKTHFLTPTTPVAMKFRPSKPWRHPVLDKRLTRQRLLAEARTLVKCRKAGVNVPAVLGMSWEEGWVAVEWIEGKVVKEAIRDHGEVGLDELLRKMGDCVGKLHEIGVVHGDLTTSNMILRPLASTSDPSSHTEEGSGAGRLDGEIVLIDFGLATQTVQEEDRAVDLYVLERAFGSTHPREEHMFELVLQAYAKSYKGSKATLRRLEDVRMRGRKKSMVG